MDMLKRLFEIIKNRKEKQLVEQERLDYIQKRVMETGIESYKNRKEESKTNTKQYFFDSDKYGKVFK